MSQTPPYQPPYKGVLSERKTMAKNSVLPAMEKNRTRLLCHLSFTDAEADMSVPLCSNLFSSNGFTIVNFAHRPMAVQIERECPYLEQLCIASCLVPPSGELSICVDYFGEHCQKKKDHEPQVLQIYGTNALAKATEVLH